MDITGIISAKRYGELLERLRRLNWDYEEMATLARETGDDEYITHMRAARRRYQDELDKIADVLGVLGGYIHEDVIRGD